MRVDLLHLARNLRRFPGSAVAAVSTLALTLGAGASIFAVLDAVLLTPPPFEEPESLVTIGEIPTTETAGVSRPVSDATFRLWRADRRLNASILGAHLKAVLGQPGVSFRGDLDGEAVPGHSPLL